MHIVKTLAIGAAAVYASDWLASTSFVSQQGPTAQMAVKYLGPGAVMLLAAKLLHVHTST